MTLINTRVRSKVCHSTQDTFHAFVFFEPLGLIASHFLSHLATSSAMWNFSFLALGTGPLSQLLQDASASECPLFPSLEDYWKKMRPLSLISPPR